MNTTKPNWQRIGIVLGGLAILAIVVGWGAHFVLDALSNDTATATVTLPTGTVATQATEPAPTPSKTLPETVSPDSTPAPTLSTSTPRPTSTSSPTPLGPIVVTVNFGEGLYQVCRRYCSGCWGDNELPPSLVNYAEKVARENGIRLSDTLKKRELIMPPCPSECP